MTESKHFAIFRTEARGNVSAIAAAFGLATVRVDISRVLAADSLTISQIADASGYTRGGIKTHLDAPRRVGAPGGRLARARESFRPARRYQVDRSRLEALAWWLFDARTEHERATAV